MQQRRNAVALHLLIGRAASVKHSRQLFICSRAKAERNFFILPLPLPTNELVFRRIELGSTGKFPQNKSIFAQKVATQEENQHRPVLIGF